MESFLTKPPLFTGSLPMMMIKASELDSISEAFAKELVERLHRFNAEHPEPITEDMPINPSENPQQFSPNPQQLQAAFQASFCRYAASRYIIIRG